MGKRVIWIILDSVGAGALPDAGKFGDEGSDTLGHIMEMYPDIKLPNMERLGLYGIEGTSFYNKNASGKSGESDKKTDIIGCYGRAKEMSNGKDTTTGHWEMIGIYTKVPFPTYPDGFPKEVIDAFVEETGCEKVYGNKTASGVPIINEYGKEHMETGYPIVYTSADSVFQIAASEEKVGLDRLYFMCQKAREILQGEHGVGRVIARPFIRKEDGTFERTSNRRDYALNPDVDNVLCHLKNAGLTVAAVGKISDIFNGVGITEEVHTTGNMDGMKKTAEYMEKVSEGLIFTNLVDFDMKYGHRRDVLGYKNALEEFDAWLGEMLPNLREDDLLIINADHGCDPAFKGTDHTREYIPVLVYGKNLKQNVNLGTLESFGDLGKTVEAYLLGEAVSDTKAVGTSFCDKII